MRWSLVHDGDFDAILHAARDWGLLERTGPRLGIDALVATSRGWFYAKRLVELQAVCQPWITLWSSFGHTAGFGWDIHDGWFYVSQWHFAPARARLPGGSWPWYPIDPQVPIHRYPGFFANVSLHRVPAPRFIQGTIPATPDPHAPRPARRPVGTGVEPLDSPADDRMDTSSTSD